MLLIITFIYGLLIGSFLNVVIFRLPLILNGKLTSLINPKRSFCPNCKHKLGFFELIPVISFFIQNAKCKHCQAKISFQYPLVELLTAIISVLIVYKFDLGIETIFYLFFTYSVISLFMIDLKYQLLPDIITIPLVWIGLIFNIIPYININLSDAVIGAILGYMILWSIYWLFKLIYKKEGMGYGDFKLTAVIGAWFGWQILPLVLLISSGLAILHFIFKKIINKDSNDMFAFGPFLIIASFILLFFDIRTI